MTNRFIFLDESLPILEMAIYPSGTDPKQQGWIPCQFPERPLDNHAAIKHVIKGEPCGSCAIAKDAFLKSNRRYSYGANGPSERSH